MNIGSMRVRPYHSIAVDENVPPSTAERYRTLERFDRLRAADCEEAEALAQVGISRRTMYPWNRALAPKSTRPHRVRRRACKPKDVAAVMKLRRMSLRHRRAHTLVEVIHDPSQLEL